MVFRRTEVTSFESILKYTYIVNQKMYTDIAKGLLKTPWFLDFLLNLFHNVEYDEEVVNENT
jgi:hypothetical protein